MKLGRLKKVDLREVWKTEAQHFTPWLANEENLALLGDTIGLDLECEAVEKNVGPFRADILCKDTANDSWVLIENQVERTDHTRLGQLLTYAAGLKTVTIVWIAQRFTDEHRAEIATYRRRIEQAMQDALADGVDQGVLAVDDVPGTAFALLSLGIDLVRWFEPGGSWTAEGLADLHASLAVKMTRAH